MASQESPRDDTEMLHRLAQRLVTNPHYMAGILARYKLLEGQDDESMRSKLGVSDLGMARLALCLRPDSSGKSFGADVRAIAEYASADIDAVTNLIRIVESIEELSAEASPPAQEETRWPRVFPQRRYLAAARDREGAQSEADEPDQLDQSEGNVMDDVS